ncbi:hypothetical protein BDV97DRAFT_345782 [Delphinella strobiligena]|nr:hypothetical protein BDV97DRAFT_345782 [Delphinella strobiligena]
MRPHTFEGPEALNGAFPRDVSWMVKEAVIVLWREEEPESESEEESESGKKLRRTRLRSLGQPSAMDKYPNVTLWMGRGGKEAEADLTKDGKEDEVKEEMIIMLQMTFHIKVSSGNRKKAFDMFCILPSANLVMANEQDESANFLPLSLDKLSSTVYECLKHPNPSRRLLHVRFCAQYASRVLMHHRPYIAKHVTGTPLHLMLLLKSLSRSLSFDAYLSYSTYAAECLKTVATRLECGVTTPAIDLDRVYAGVGGCLDYWEQFNPEHFTPKSPRTRFAYLQYEHAQQSPPLYSDPTHGIAATRKRQRPCSSSTNSPPRYVQSKHDRLEDGQAEKESDEPRVPPPSYAQQQPNLFLELAFSPPSPAFPLSPLAFPPTATTSNMTHSPTVLVAASHLYTSLDQTTVDYSDYVPDTPLDKVCTPDAAITTPCAATPPITTLPPAASSPITILPPAASSSSSKHSVSIESPPLVPTLICLFRSWILDMHTLAPGFYKLQRFHIMLLSLASAAISASKNDFIQAKAKATTSVLVLARYVPNERETDKDTHRIIDLNLLHELDLMLQWMYTHDLDATGAEPGHNYGHGPLLIALRHMAAWAAAFRKTYKTCVEDHHLIKEMPHQPSDAGKREAGVELKPEALVHGFRQWEGECVAQFYLSLVTKAGRPF